MTISHTVDGETYQVNDENRVMVNGTTVGRVEEQDVVAGVAFTVEPEDPDLYVVRIPDMSNEQRLREAVEDIHEMRQYKDRIHRLREENEFEN